MKKNKENTLKESLGKINMIEVSSLSFPERVEHLGYLASINKKLRGYFDSVRLTPKNARIVENAIEAHDKIIAGLVMDIQDKKSLTIGNKSITPFNYSTI